MTAVVVVLMIVAGGLELVGLYLVAREIGTAVRQAERIVPARFEQAMPLKVVQGRRPMPKSQGDTIENRVAHLEALSNELEDLVYQRTTDLNDRIAQVATNVADAGLDVHTREKVIREFLREMLIADLSARRLGVRLLAGGIVLATVANVLSVTAT